MSSIGTIMLPITPSIIFWRSSSRKSRNGGPALLAIKMSGSGQAANSASWPCLLPTSAATAWTLAPVALRISAAVASSRLASSPLTTISQPASASRMAQARPSPRLDAQTMALRPAIPRSMGVLPVVGRSMRHDVAQLSQAAADVRLQVRLDDGQRLLNEHVAAAADVGRDNNIRYRPERAVRRQRLLGEHVQCGARDLAGLQVLDQGRLVEHAAAREVDQEGRGLHRRQHL